MIDTHDLKSRDHYLNKLIAFRDTEPVKVVTGMDTGLDSSYDGIKPLNLIQWLLG